MTDPGLIPRVTTAEAFTGHCPAPTCSYSATGRTVPAVLAAMVDHERWHQVTAGLRTRDAVPHTVD